MDHSALSSGQHRANLFANLDRRMAVARCRCDPQLVALLEQEYQQLRADGQLLPSQRRGVRQWFRRRCQLRVEQGQDWTGQSWWQGFDPSTGQTVWGTTEAEVLRWIEDNQLGS